MFSIIIPTWNNLDFVKLCVESIQKNSGYKHQIILHINDGSDGTRVWAENNHIEYTWSSENIGICMAVNQSSLLAKFDYIVYMNDDMYVCPFWDKYLLDSIQLLDTDCFMLSSTMIEPKGTANECVIVKDFGDSVTNFRENDLLTEFESMNKEDWNGATWPPTVVSRKYWIMSGGYSIELSPGMSSDDDFSMKMWTLGCRIFKGVGKSKVYHFQTKSTHRIKKNDGRKQFLFKWGINQSTFNKYFLKRGTKFTGPLMEPSETIMKKEVFRAWLKMKLTSNRFK